MIRYHIHMLFFQLYVVEYLPHSSFRSLIAWQVVANAVRTISHASYFVYSQESLIDSAAMATCKDLLAKLSAKVNFSLDDAVGGAPKGLSWKRRNGAKKQTRGSCTTLGVLLNYSILIQNVDVEILEVSLSCLFRCILSCHVDEKIVGAAITSLLGLPNSLWQRISCNCDSVGRGLATIFGYLERVRLLYSICCAFQHSSRCSHQFFPQNERRIQGQHVISTSNLWRFRSLKEQKNQIFVICSLSERTVFHSLSSISTSGW